MEFPTVVALVLGLIALSLFRRHLRDSKMLQLRRILHDERMKALEKGGAVPEADDSQLAELLGPAAADRGRSALFASVLWVRIVALCLGLASVLGGAGSSLAMYLVTEDDIHQAWPMGLIPVFIGVGLLIFYAGSKNLAALAAAGPREAQEQ